MTEPPAGSGTASRVTTSAGLLERYAAGDRRFEHAELFEADLTGATLAGVSFPQADLREAKLAGANLSRADLTGANLWSADLSRATLDQAIVSPGTVLTRANLTEVDLTTVQGEPLLDLTIIRNARFPAGSGRWKRLVHRLTGRYSVRAAAQDVVGWVGRGFRKPGAGEARLAATPSPTVLPAWVLLRRTYTGTRFAWLFLLTALFLIPLGWRTAFWMGVNHAQTAAGPTLAELSAWMNRQDSLLSERLPTRADSAVRRMGEPLRGRITPCLAARCDTVPVVRSLFRIGEPATRIAGLLGRYGLTVLLLALLLFNVARGWLTYRVGALRDVEEESGVSPARDEYRRLWRAHLLARVLQILAVVAFLDNALGLLAARVAVPQGWFR